MFSHCPLGYVAIGITTVISKSTDAPTLCCIDILICNHVNGCLVVHQKRVRTHLVLLQHHEVEMSDALLRILSHTLHESRVTDNIAYVLIDECVSVNRVEHEERQKEVYDSLSQIVCCSQAESFLFSLNDMYRSVFSPLKTVW